MLQQDLVQSAGCAWLKWVSAQVPRLFEYSLPTAGLERPLPGCRVVIRGIHHRRDLEGAIGYVVRALDGDGVQFSVVVPLRSSAGTGDLPQIAAVCRWNLHCSLQKNPRCDPRDT